MKLLFFSADGSEVEMVNRELASAGIPYLIRQTPAPRGILACPSAAEVWLCKDGDYHRASLLCVKLGVGFTSRSIKRSARLWTDLDSLQTPQG